MDLGGAGVWALAAVRVFAILRAQVVWRVVVGPAWWLVAGALAVVLAPVTASAVPEGVSRVGVTALVLELVVGTVLGLVVALPGHALLGAAAVGEAVLGSAAPGARSFSRLVPTLALALGLALGLHGPLVLALAGTFDAWPPGAWPAAADALDHATTIAMLAHAMLLLALALVTPVLLAVLIVDVATGLVASGGEPAGAVISGARPWLRAAMALVALGASWAAYPGAWARGMG